MPPFAPALMLSLLLQPKDVKVRYETPGGFTAVCWEALPAASSLRPPGRLSA